jgi:uncharacterized protein YjcR
MADKHVLAEQDYLAGMKYREIAEKYDVTINTVKSWKRRHGWNRDAGAPSADGVHQKRPGAPPGNKNAVGNNGGAPKGNQNAATHGLFAKYLPDETREILQQLETRSPLDMLWDSIVIQHAAIIRAQQLMYVRDQQDKTVERIEEKAGNVSGERWEVQQAWDKHATFLQAQSRAMATLQSLIKRYDEMLKTDPATEEQQLRIKKLRGEVALIEQKVTNDDDKPIEIVITRKGERS